MKVTDLKKIGYVKFVVIKPIKKSGLKDIIWNIIKLKNIPNVNIGTVYVLILLTNRVYQQGLSQGLSTGFLNRVTQHCF